MSELTADLGFVLANEVLAETDSGMALDEAVLA